MKVRRLIGFAVVSLLGVSLWWVYWPSYGVGVNSVGWLPSAAHNITYMKNDLNGIAEFDVEQGAFEKWCDREGMPLRKLSEYEYRYVERCLPYLERKGLIPPVASPNDNAADLDAAGFGPAAKLLRGGDLYYEEDLDSGGAYRIGYDVREKRGYYYFNRR